MSVNAHRGGPWSDRDAAHLGASGGVELDHGASVVQADKQAVRFNQQGERRAADMLLPCDVEIRQPHRIYVPWPAVGDVGKGAVCRHRYRYWVGTD